MLGQTVFPDWESPVIDWTAFGPELVVVAGIVVLVLLDAFGSERGRPLASVVTGLTLLGAMIPVLFMADQGDVRSMFGGAYVVDNFALLLKAVFLLSAYVVVLLSTNYIAEGDYWENEYYTMLLASLGGMLVISSARDLITIFVALEMLSIPAYLLAAWRKRDVRSNEAGIKYFVIGVFATGLFLYGMSLLFGSAGSTQLTAIADAISVGDTPTAAVVLGIVLVVAGFGFKVSAFPFHAWAPDVYEGAPTPLAAYLSVASKAAGFVVLLQLVFIGFGTRSDVYEPLMWVLAAGSMTAGNLMALRQTNIVRLMAYSGVAQAGFMLAPLAVAGHSAAGAERSLEAVLTYLVIYAAMNLGAFAVIMAGARKTRSGEIDSFRGMFQYAPGLTVLMTIFLMSLAGIPPLGGWFAKLHIFSALISAESVSGAVLAVVAGVNAVIALFYYASVARRMWADEVPDGDMRRIHLPPSLTAALGITAVLTLLFGIVPQTVGHFTSNGLFALVG